MKVRVPTNTSIREDLKKRAHDLQKKGLMDGFSKLLEFAIEFREAELYDCEYPSNKLSDKIEKLSERLSEALRVPEALDGNKSVEDLRNEVYF